MAQPQQRPAVGVVRFYNFLPEGLSFLGEVLAGLAQSRKALPSNYFYDARGRDLYEQLCRSPEYYCARAELEILREHGAALAEFLGPDCQLIEFGCGMGAATHMLIDKLRPQLYVPVETAGEEMRSATDGLVQAFPWLNISAICADCTGALTLPQFVGVPIRKKVVYFPASAIGYYTPQRALESLQLARRMVGTGGALLAAVDPKKPEQVLAAAYDDAAGIIAAFNLNLVARINRELGADFQLRRFRHLALCTEDGGRIELRVESLASQLVHVGGVRFNFTQGETMLTGVSCKYGLEEFRELAQRAGFAPAHAWTDAANLFSVLGLTAV